VSYETYALVRDIVIAEARPPITMKGISREVVPYAITGMVDAHGQTVQVFNEHTPPSGTCRQHATESGGHPLGYLDICGILSSLVATRGNTRRHGVTLP
jgi:hypothetical protein